MIRMMIYWSQQQYNQTLMSLDQIRKLRLLKDLEKTPKKVSKSQIKNRTLTSISQTDNLRRLNKNKKYMLQEEKNTEIERNNRLLYQKIMGHFQSLKETTQHRNKWRKKKKKVKLVQEEDSELEHKMGNSQSNSLKFRSRVQTIKQIKVSEPQTLFLGRAIIDGIAFKTKLTLSAQRYLLLAKNVDLSIQLEMDYKEYLNFQEETLKGNPSNIFQYLQIDGREIKFRERISRIENIDFIKSSKTKTVI